MKALKKGLRYVGETIRWSVLGGIAGLTACVGALYGTGKVVDFFSPELETQSQLESYLSEKIQQLQITDKDITIRFGSTEPFVGSEVDGVTFKSGPNKYGIVISPEDREKSTVRHELYHIADGHFEKLERSGGERSLWPEVQATMYAATGLKF